MFMNLFYSEISSCVNKFLSIIILIWRKFSNYDLWLQLAEVLKLQLLGLEVCSLELAIHELDPSQKYYHPL
jgi:hypothetical protein